MADKGYGLTRETVMELAFKIVDKTGRKNPFQGGKAGRAWFEGFRRRHPQLSLRTPQPLSYCRAVSANQSAVNDFFGKLGSLFGQLNLISKPMLIYNCDETGISIVHKPGKVVAEMGRRNVYALTSAERGKTHTVLACVSASGHVLPPMIIYPRKRCVPDAMKEGAVPDTLFMSSETGWINSELYLQWFQFFLDHIPPVRPVLLLEDGHASHTSIEVLELARANGVHILCFPAHSTHVLQPLDVGVFKSFKTHFSKACTRYMSEHPGRVVTADKLASLVAEAWPSSFTNVNIMSGFKKTGIYPLNPGEVSDRQLAPSTAFRATEPTTTDVSPGSPPESPLFSPEQVALYKRRYAEKYDILDDPGYVAWLKIYHPNEKISPSPSSSVSSGKKSSQDALSEVLVLPQPKPMSTKQLKKKAAVCLTDYDELERCKAEQDEKKKAAEAKELRRALRERKREEREKQEKERQEKRGRNKKGEGDKQGTRKPVRGRGKCQNKGVTDLAEELLAIQIASDSSEDSDATCPKCGLRFSEDSGTTWIACNSCHQWYNLSCTKIKNRKKIPSCFYCENCV